MNVGLDGISDQIGVLLFAVHVGLLVPHDQGMGARRDRDILEALLLVTGRGLVLVPVPGMGM